jgi:hypothetical protein
VKRRLQAQGGGELAPFAGQPGVDGLHRVRRPVGQAGAFRWGEQGQQRLGDERMAEGVPVRRLVVRRHQLRGRLALQVAEQVPVVQAGGRLDDGQREPAAQHGGHRQQLPGRLAEPVDPLGHAAGQRGGQVGVQLAGDDPASRVLHQQAGAQHSVEQLLGDQGIAGAVRPQPVGDLLR